MRTAPYLIGLMVVQGLLVAADERAPVELTIHARAIESPVLKYRLFPGEAELKPGNAAVILLRLPWEEAPYVSQMMPTLRDWDARPLSDPAWKTAPNLLPFYDEIKRAAYRRDASWEYPIGEQPLQLILLPDVQGLRTLLGYGLSAEIRRDIAHARLDMARERILVGLANARHMAATPFYVNQLVAATIHRAMLDRTAELISQPASPNLYWALSSLPKSRTQLDRAASLEASAFLLGFPAAGELDRARDPQEWSRMFDQLAEFLRLTGDSQRAAEMSVDKLLPRFTALGRAELPQLTSTSAEAVAAMADHEVAVRWFVVTIVRHQQQVSATLCLCPTEAWTSLARLHARREQLEQATGLKFTFFSPTSAYLAIWSLERKIHALRIVEAVRHHLATHDGKLPATLADIESVPVPLDPLSGRPFEWKLIDAGSARLSATFLPQHPGEGADDYVVDYLLRVK